ncbi:transcriptional regulator, XRE family [Desulfarculus baarsii DSM 2075]|uniref:Transcriptional regulator, XRE family n=1 Tax=Desulfarculus baarsii (strain ATCC 33931 / DSM 2075 / LMG 7858 / VKM B-1802 / 2st14) TaxID=644282 RepID=E1QLG8_DESB2|nr:cupin domain-containing protein [Desulfarculus baarsii]ADK86403.1 transcriptional regulator, XRE family [Desulfarculus baarsii DSM 2075]
MSAKKLGERIADYRQKQGLSLEQMAQRTGLDQQFLSAVEAHDLYPSLGPLIKIARTLGVRLGTFLDDQTSQDPLIVRLGQRQRQITTHRGEQGPESTVFYSLGLGKVDRHMEPFFVELLPGDEDAQKRSSHEGEEFIVVVEGQVELIYGAERFVLEPGDSMYYNSVVPHHVAAAGGQKAAIYAVLYLPE